MDTLRPGSNASLSSLHGQQAAPRLALSLAQREVLVAGKLDGTNPRYNCGGYLDVSGVLDKELLAQAVQTTVAECTALRAHFEGDGATACQRIDVSEAPLQVLDFSGLPDAHERALAWMREDLGRAVEVSTGTLFTHALLSVGEDRTYFYFRYHHILLDGFGQALYWRRLADVYSCLTEGRPVPPCSFGALSELIQEDLTYQGSPGYEQDRGFWRQELAEFPEPVSLGARPSFQISRNVLKRTQSLILPDGGLHGAAAAAGTHWSVVVLAAAAIYVHRVTSALDVVIGLPVRSRAGRVALATPGMRANELPLRLQLRPESTLDEVMKQVSSKVSAVLSHQRYRSEELYRELRRGGGGGLQPTVTVNVVSFDGNLKLAACEGVVRQLSSGPVRDLQIEVFGGTGGKAVEICLEANAENYTAEALDAHHRRFLGLLAEISSADRGVSIGELPLLLGDERARLLAFANGESRPYDLSRCLHELVGAQAIRTPHATALVFGGESLTYAELVQRADALAATLQAAGVCVGQPVGVHELRSLELVVGLLAVMKAGGAYLPLDPELPVARLQFQIHDAGISVVLCRASQAERLRSCGATAVALDEVIRAPAAPRPAVSGCAVSPADPAYVLYTSGSTGQPKAVVVPHRGIVNRLLWMQEAYRLDASDCVLQKTPFTFDVSVWEFFWPLITGAKLVLAAPELHRDPRYLAEVMREHAVTTVHFVPPMLELFLREPGAARLPALRRVVCSGEALRPETVRGFFERYEDPALYNLYGPTEASIDVSHWTCSPSDAGGPIPIGRPVANTQLYVLEPSGQLSPMGATGELYIGGVQVATGYLNRPELTRSRFIRNPFGEGALYRTGDVARYRSDGAIEFLGRIDDQVKIRGNRVELGEIESALLALPEISQATVVAPVQPDGQRQVLAYVVGKGVPIDAAAVDGALRAKLPGYMVPAHVIELPALPLSVSGKVDRKALPPPSPVTSPRSAAKASPSTPDEALLLRAWCEVLRIENAGVDESFFALGGDSMSAIQVRAAMEAQGQTFTIPELFANPTIRRLAGCLREAPVWTRSARSQPFSLLASADLERLPAGVDDAYPLSSMQAGMLFHAASARRSSLYRVVTSLRLAARFELEALRAALRDLTRRHPSLRCSFDLTHFSEPLQLVHHEVEVPIELGADLSRLSPAEHERAVTAWIEEAKYTAFELSAAPLFRFAVHPCGPQEFRLTVVEHHVVLDGWSDMRMLEELVAHYRARLAGQELWLPEVASTYRDFVAAERSAIAKAESRDYWLSILRGAEATVLPRREDAASGIRRFDVPVSRALAEQLRLLAQREQLPLKAVLAAAHLVVQRAYSGRDEVMTGIVANARLEERGGDEVIGVFLNTLPLRIDLAGKSLLDAARQVFQLESDSVPHRRYPLGQMLRDLGHDLQLDSYVNFMDFHADPTNSATAGMVVDAGVAETNYPLAVDFLIDPAQDQLRLWLDCDLGVLAEELCARLVRAYGRALSAAVAQPHAPISELELLDPEEREQFARWNATEQEYDARVSIPELVARQAERTPDAVALVHGWREMTYAELELASGRVAGYLRRRGVGAGHLVGVAVRRSVDLVVALLGVMKTGAAYVPMDPAFPKARLELIGTDANIFALVTSGAAIEGASAPLVLDLAAEAAELEATPPLAGVEASGDDNAYVIYTSGSTGKPKGTAIRHRNVINFFAGMERRIGCSAADVMLAVTSVSFDISVLELLWPLTRGAKVVVASEGIVSHLSPQPETADKTLGFSLFFFAATSSGGSNREAYQLVLDAARFADTHDFEAVWTPERHFHAFGGLYPNPSVMSAALATITRKVALRCGSVVAPLHDSIRMVEEWSLVDNLSAGRVGLAFASGWNSNDFALQPGRYEARKQVMIDQLDEFRRLWRGETVRRVNGTGQEVELRVFPQPVQAEPPIWFTSVGSLDTFERAGAAGVNVLTHLLGQRPEELEEKITAYRRARAAHGHPGRGHVTIMIHTHLGEDASEAKRRARGPFREYLRSSTELWRTLFTITGKEFGGSSSADLEAVIELAIERYFETSGLFGSPDTCADLVRLLDQVGVDEIACLVDFGLEAQDVVSSLKWIDKLRRATSREAEERQHTLVELCHRHRVTMLQGTPSLLSAVAAEAAALEAMRGIRALMVGGEAFPSGLAQRLLRALPGTQVFNMYGPTETTIWSTVHELDPRIDLESATISIGRAISNTHLQVMNLQGRPAPIGVSGELWIGGDGVAAGYLGRPELTAERFVTYQDVRYYRTGDRVRWRRDGSIDFLGRMDRQVKILGHRIEPDEIESVLSQHADVEAVAVVARDGGHGPELVAYVAPKRTLAFDPETQRAYVRHWGEVWEDTYARTDERAIQEEFAGWNSSYDGKPIPASEMREWLDHTVQRIRSLQPRAIIDIGVGVGLVLRELAPSAEEYHGVDIAATALSAAARSLGPVLPQHVRLANCGPEYLSRLPAQSADVVVLNSVIQYFPSTNYLREVLTDAVRVIRSGGAVFIGDVRAVEMLPEFHTSVQLHRAQALQSVDDLRHAVARQLQDERELCVSPAFFRALQQELPEISEVTVELKRGRADNELTRFRYDVTLHVSPRVGADGAARALSFDDLPGGLVALQAQLGRSQGSLVVTGIPNQRLHRVTEAKRLLQDLPQRATAWDLDRLLWEVDVCGSVHPEDVIGIAEAAGLQVRLVVPQDGRLERFDAVFHAQEELS